MMRVRLTLYPLGVAILAGGLLLGCTKKQEEPGATSQPPAPAVKASEPEKTGGATVGEEQVQYTCPMHPEVKQAGPGKCPKCGMNLVEAKGKQANPSAAASKVATPPTTQPTGARTAEKTYLCPMHPNVISDKPGKCPECGMDLEEGVYACEMCGVYENKPGKCPIVRDGTRVDTEE